MDGRFALLWELDQEARSEEGIARLLSLGYKVRMRLPDVSIFIHWALEECYLTFSQFISHIQPDDPDKYRSALRQDDIHAMRTLKELISSDTGQKALLALSQDEDAAEWILNLIDKVCVSVFCSGLYLPCSCSFMTMAHFGTSCVAFQKA